MTNADVIQMVNAALSEQVITTSIRQATTKDFDLTPTGLIALKKVGVSDAVIQVMQEVSNSAKSGSTAGNKVPADDREQTVNAVLRQAVTSQSGGAITLTSFQKTNSAEIVTVLSKRDDLNSDVASFRPGGYGYRFIFGSTTDMSPGQSLMVTMSFVQDANRTTSVLPPKVFQMATEIVVGVLKSGTKKSHSLHNVIFDQVSLPGR